MRFKRTYIKGGIIRCEYECPDEELENLKNPPIIDSRGGKTYYEENGKEHKSHYFPRNATLIKSTFVSWDELSSRSSSEIDDN